MKKLFLIALCMLPIVVNAHDLNTIEGRVNRVRELVPLAAEHCTVPATIPAYFNMQPDVFFNAGGTHQQLNCMQSYINGTMSIEVQLSAVAAERQAEDQRQREVRAEEELHQRVVERAAALSEERNRAQVNMLLLQLGLELMARANGQTTQNYPGNCYSYYDRAGDGSLCGNRAAQVRPGGWQ